MHNIIYCVYLFIAQIAKGPLMFKGPLAHNGFIKYLVIVYATRKQSHIHGRTTRIILIPSLYT